MLELTQDISESWISQRAKNCLINEGYKTWAEVSEVPYASHLLRISNLGRVTYNEIITQLHARYPGAKFEPDADKKRRLRDTLIDRLEAAKAGSEHASLLTEAIEEIERLRAAASP